MTRSRRSILASLVALSAGCLGSPRGTTTSGTPPADSTPTETPHGDPPSPTGTTRTSTETPTTPTETPAAPTIDAVEGAWPTPAFDAGRTRHDPDSEVPGEAPRTAWTASLPERPDQVVVGEGLVVVGARERVLAFDAATGRPQWGRRFGSPRRTAGPVLGDDGVLVGVGAAVVALDPADGTTRWRTATGAGAPGHLQPVDGTVYVGTDGADGGDPVVVALDAAGVDWTAGPGDWPAGRFAEVAVTGDAVYTVAWSGGSATSYYAIDRATGERRWRELAVSHATALTVAEGTLLAGGFYGQAEAVAAIDGRSQWEATDHNAVATIAAVGGAAHVAGYDQPHAANLHSYRLSDGSAGWTARQGGTLLGAGDALVTVTDSAVAAVDRTTGEQRWRRSLPGGPAALADGVLFVASDDGTLLALA